jgi:hypothetical protein
MQVVAYTHSGHSPSMLYWFADLFVIGLLRAAPGRDRGFRMSNSRWPWSRAARRRARAVPGSRASRGCRWGRRPVGSVAARRRNAPRSQAGRPGRDAGWRERYRRRGGRASSGGRRQAGGGPGPGDTSRGLRGGAQGGLVDGRGPDHRRRRPRGARSRTPPQDLAE